MKLPKDTPKPTYYTKEALAKYRKEKARAEKAKADAEAEAKAKAAK